MRIEIRPATKADFDALIAEPLPHRVRAKAVTVDGELQGVGCLVYLPDGTVAASMHVIEGARRYKVAMHKAALQLMQDARELGIGRVVAMADENIDRAIPWLERLGFRPETVSGETIWIWHKDA